MNVQAFSIFIYRYLFIPENKLLWITNEWFFSFKYRVALFVCKIYNKSVDFRINFLAMR